MSYYDVRQIERAESISCTVFSLRREVCIVQMCMSYLTLYTIVWIMWNRRPHGVHLTLRLGCRSGFWTHISHLSSLPVDVSQSKTQASLVQGEWANHATAIGGSTPGRVIGPMFLREKARLAGRAQLWTGKQARVLFCLCLFDRAFRRGHCTRLTCFLFSCLSVPSRVVVSLFP